MKEAYCKDLIWPDRSITIVAGYDIIKAFSFSIPKLTVKAHLGDISHCRKSLFPISVFEAGSKLGHYPQSIEPKRLYLDRLPSSRRNNPIADLCVHPCELDACAAGIKQTVGINVYIVPRTPNVPFDDVYQFFVKKVAYELSVLRFLQIRSRGFEKPKRRVDGVVLGFFANVRKTIREHSFRNMIREFSEDTLCNFGPVRRKRQSRQGDH